MDCVIRPIELSDARGISRIRRQPGVMKHTLGLPSDRVISSEDFIKNLDEDSFILVAEVESKVVGIASLDIGGPLRERHIGSIGVSVDVNYHGKGIGRSLMESLLDIADNFLKLVRVELGVDTENIKAQKLYKSLGFEVEGTRKYCAITDGKYKSDYYMARYNLYDN